MATRKGGREGTEQRARMGRDGWTMTASEWKRRERPDHNKKKKTTPASTASVKITLLAGACHSWLVQSKRRVPGCRRWRDVFLYFCRCPECSCHTCVEAATSIVWRLRSLWSSGYLAGTCVMLRLGIGLYPFPFFPATATTKGIKTRRDGLSLLSQEHPCNAKDSEPGSKRPTSPFCSLPGQALFERCV